MNTVTKMHALAKSAQKNAYAPYSQFFVGACIRSNTGNYYVGCNVENASYGLSLCAEANAITNMICQGAQLIAEIIIVTSANKPCPPCGACLQRIKEFATTNLPIHLADETAITKSLTLNDLFPQSFNAAYLEKQSC